MTLIVTTAAIDPARPNDAPSAWLEREGWRQPTPVDDATNSALQALGIGTFPGLVLVDGDGRVAQRVTGEISAPQFVELLLSITPGG